jgi:F-type H+-transporting ATPase subunit a
MLYACLVLLAISVFVRVTMKMVPGLAQSMIECVVESLSAQCDEMIGKEGKKFLPFIVTLFLYILISNFFGLIPGLLPPTAELSNTVGLALFVFFATHIIGIQKHGPKYLKRFLGPYLALAPLMLPIELIGHMARPFSLSLRLWANMMAHEQVVMVLLILMPIAYPLLAFSTLLGVLVIVIQAFVFSLLTMAYIGGALEEEH